jgi:hypothetical protein
MTQINCFLCNGTNHIPVECNLYSTVQQINQQAKDGLCHLLGRAAEDGRPKMKMKMKDVEIATDATTKYCFS